jgi:hypothetical protein
VSGNGNWTAPESAFAIVALACVLLFHGALPFLMSPTLGQAVWTSGFAQSFANGPLLSIYAHDFGLPKPAAIAFGFAGAWPESWLIRLGLRPTDAYAGMAAVWLALAFCSAYQLSRLSGVTRSVAILGAVTWMSMPVIWEHAGYSMLSFGIGLLPFYFLAVFNLCNVNSIVSSSTLFYVIAVFISVFMDGYTFMMFAAGSSILFCYLLLTDAAKRRSSAMIILPVHIFSFLLATVAYIAYVGKSSFDQSPLDAFRGWGLDLSFAVIPSRNILWLPDTLGLSVHRTNDLYFGDVSVWRTTFSLPTIFFGLIAWWQIRRQRNLATGYIIIALVAFFMALGPSVKINSTKPEDMQLAHPREQSAMMPAEFAVAPTGSAWLSETLPGFKSMRASYRWSALGVFAMWAVIGVWSGSIRKNHRIPVVVFSVITVLNAPNIPQRFRALMDNRMQFIQLSDNLTSKLRNSIGQNEIVAFVPWGNDFIVNYLAPAVGFRAFNIGGDKNLFDAQSNWPSTMLALGGDLDMSKISYIVRMLFEHNADMVVVPYFHMLWSPHLWPCVDQTSAILTESMKDEFNRIPGFYCPDQRRITLLPVIQKIKDLPYVEVADNDLFATVKLRPEFAGETSRQALLNAVFRHIRFPIEFGSGLGESDFILKEGWYSVEQHHVWSKSASRLVLPIPGDCAIRQCLAVLHFYVFGASEKRPVAVAFESETGFGNWKETIISTTQADNKILVPLDGKKDYQEIAIKVPDATSPRELMNSPDDRTLGIGLLRADLL